MQTIKYTHSDVPVSLNSISNMRIVVTSDDMFKVVKEVIERYPTSKVLFHNFANDFSPCAENKTSNSRNEYTRISNSQEAQLFQKTQIGKSLTKDLYPISPGIILTKNLSYSNVSFDVATIATLSRPRKKKCIVSNPNQNLTYEVFSDPSDIEITKDRMRLFLKLASNYDFVITGAWGCGVFNNPMYGLCQYWNELMKEIPQRNVLFVTYDDQEYEHFSHFIVEF